MSYKPYRKSEFQRCLSAIADTGNLLRWDEISESLDTPEHKVWEYVYRFHLKNPSVSILIFSSVYKENDWSREISSDAVRIVFEWQTSHGLIYTKIATKYRVDTLFENLTQELVTAAQNCFDLGQYQPWVYLIEQIGS